VVAMGSVKSAKGGQGTHEGDEVSKREDECPGSESFTLIFVTTGWSQKVVAMGSVKSAKGGQGTHEGDEVRKREDECPGKREFYPHLCDHWVVTKSGRNGECKNGRGI